MNLQFYKNKLHKFVDRIFSQLDVDGDGLISQQEYVSAVLKNSLFIQSLGLLDDDDYKDGTSMFDGSISSGMSITFGHPDWELVQNMLLGIRSSTGEAVALRARNLKRRDFEHEVTHESKRSSFIFRDFAPRVYASIRDLFGIDQRAYMFALGPEKVLGNLLLGNMVALCEVMSTGRSGSFFFRSNDNRYLIKTLPAREEALLRELTFSYYSHISHYPNTLLSRFYGCYRMIPNDQASSLADVPSLQPNADQSIELKTNNDQADSSSSSAPIDQSMRYLGKMAPSLPYVNSANPMLFVVMNNLFNPDVPIHEQYDLKGSTVSRTIGEKAFHKRDPSKAMKDLDFKRLNRRIHIGPERKALLLEQIELDTRWMQAHNICDYSLLVGIHFIDDDDDVNFPQNISKREPSLFKPNWGGMLSVQRNAIYYIGLIDILTVYDFQKKGEHALKSLKHDPSLISAIPPDPYRKRFLKYVDSIIE